MTEHSIRELLGEHQFFAGMEPAHLDVLAGCAQNEVLPAGTTIAREGDPAERFYAVRTGRIAVGVHVPQHQSLVITTIGPGEVLGWSWLFAPYAWRFDAEATHETHALVLDGACLRGKCDADPALGYAVMRRFARVLVQRVEATRLQLLDVYGKSDAR